MSRDTYFMLIVGVAILNGIFNPVAKLWMFATGPVWFQTFVPFLPVSIPLVNYFASLIIASLTLMLAGIPAAAFERLTGRQDSDNISLTVWFAGALILSIPALEAVSRLLLTRTP